MLRDVLIQKGLSNREAEVAELVTKGLSNKEVANRFDFKGSDARVEQGEKTLTVRSIKLPAGPLRLEASLMEGEMIRGVRYVEVRKAE